LETGDRLKVGPVLMPPLGSPERIGDSSKRKAVSTTASNVEIKKKPLSFDGLKDIALEENHNSTYSQQSSHSFESLQKSVANFLRTPPRISFHVAKSPNLLPSVALFSRNTAESGSSRSQAVVPTTKEITRQSSQSNSKYLSIVTAQPGDESVIRGNFSLQITKKDLNKPLPTMPETPKHRKSSSLTLTPNTLYMMPPQTPPQTPQTDFKTPRTPDTKQDEYYSLFSSPPLSIRKKNANKNKHKSVNHQNKPSIDSTITTSSWTKTKSQLLNSSKSDIELPSPDSRRPLQTPTRQQHKLKPSSRLLRESIPSDPVFKVIYAYSPQLEDELELIPGERIMVYRQFDDGWCFARLLNMNLPMNQHDYHQRLIEGVCTQACLDQ
jgi:hypothetical protein